MYKRILEDYQVKREVLKALHKMKSGKAAGVDEIANELLKKVGNCIIDWLVRIFSVCMALSEVSKDWQNACLVATYMCKRDIRKCLNYRGLSLIMPCKLVVYENGDYKDTAMNRVSP